MADLGNAYKPGQNVNESKIKRLRFVQNLKYLYHWPKRSWYGKFTLFAITYTVFYTVGVKLIYGNDHPLNRYTYV